MDINNYEKAGNSPPTDPVGQTEYPCRLMEMYFNALPKVAESVAKPLNNVQNITMYGEGNNSKLVEDITKGINQIMSGISEGTGLDIKSLIGEYQLSKTNDEKEFKSESLNDMTYDNEDDMIVSMD